MFKLFFHVLYFSDQWSSKILYGKYEVCLYVRLMVRVEVVKKVLTLIWAQDKLII